MRISDWSSDVCSSDLGLRILSVQYLGHLPRAGHLVIDAVEIGLPHRMDRKPVAAACFGRVERHHRARIVHRHDDRAVGDAGLLEDRSEEHTSELQSLMRISYAVFCLKKKKNNMTQTIEQLLCIHVNKYV